MSKNKPSMRSVERAHVERLKAMPCIVCGSDGPSDAHEPEQGMWFASIPLCRDCHIGPHNGIHGQRSIWRVQKLTELGALARLVEKLVQERFE